MLEEPGHVVFTAVEISRSNSRFSAMKADEQLTAGKVYVLIPVCRVRSKVSESEFEANPTSKSHISKSKPTNGLTAQQSIGLTSQQSITVISHPYRILRLHLLEILLWQNLKTPKDPNCKPSSCQNKVRCLNTEDGGVVSLDWPANLVLEEESGLGGGQLSWMGRGSVDQQRQRILMLKQLFADLLLHDGGIYLLLGPRGAREGQLGRFLTHWNTRQQFLLEAARQCQDAGLYDKSIEIQKRIGAFSAALDTINKCLSEAICSLSRGRLDGESRITGIIHSGNEILETFKYYPEIRFL
ncbi:Nuclear pore protein [Abeliophyllum distichum]|uniref:Nuclear pore protein n=1 Tax=Abeliophyllum distichum TaxID=126358 RepID=A0ABD1NRR0_9LAMI